MFTRKKQIWKLLIISLIVAVLGIKYIINVDNNRQELIFTQFEDISMETKNITFGGMDVDNALLKGRSQTYVKVVNKLLTDYYPELAARFERTVEEHMSASDEFVVNIARAMMDGPTTKGGIKLSEILTHTPQSQFMTSFFRTINVANGFFIECGALDGERSSNTLYLEREYNWTGLLIEADPYFYTQLMGKNRNSWSINACLSPKNNTMWAIFQTANSGQGQSGRGHLTGIKHQTSRTRHVNKQLKVPCFPLETLLLALGRTKVDFFSLDIEGLELEVLQTIPFNKFDISTWTIEYPRNSPEYLMEFMLHSDRGYVNHTIIYNFNGTLNSFARDVIYVKKHLVVN